MCGCRDAYDVFSVKRQPASSVPVPSPVPTVAPIRPFSTATELPQTPAVAAPTVKDNLLKILDSMERLNQLSLITISPQTITKVRNQQDSYGKGSNSYDRIRIQVETLIGNGRYPTLVDQLRSQNFI